MTESRNHGTTEGQGESSIAPLFQSGAIKIRIAPGALKTLSGIAQMKVRVNPFVKIGLISRPSQNMQKQVFSDIHTLEQGPASAC